jgi:hypothetical protein
VPSINSWARSQWTPSSPVELVAAPIARYMGVTVAPALHFHRPQFLCARRAPYPFAQNTSRTKYHLTPRLHASTAILPTTNTTPLSLQTPLLSDWFHITALLLSTRSSPAMRADLAVASNFPFTYLSKAISWFLIAKLLLLYVVHAPFFQSISDRYPRLPRVYTPVAICMSDPLTIFFFRHSPIQSFLLGLVGIWETCSCTQRPTCRYMRDRDE